MSQDTPSNEPKSTGLSGFEQSLTELETLVKQLEQGDMPLEDALKAFERGVTLTRECQQSLRAAEQRVEQVLENQAGELERQPFAEKDDE